MPNSISAAHVEIAETARESPLCIDEIAEHLRHPNMELDVRLQYENQLPANKHLIAGKRSKCLRLREDASAYVFCREKLSAWCSMGAETAHMQLASVARSLLGIAFGSYWMSNACVVHAHPRHSAGGRTELGCATTLRTRSAVPEAMQASDLQTVNHTQRNSVAVAPMTRVR